MNGTSDFYQVALAYSNIQSREGLPIVVSGVVSFQDSLRELQQRDLPRKHNLMNRVNRFYALQEVFNDVAPYLEDHKASVFYGTKDVQKDVESAYLKLLRILTKSQLYLIIGRTQKIVCRIIESFNKNSKKWEEVPFSKGFVEELLKYVDGEDSLVFAHDRQYDRLLDIAKVLASAEYERTKLTQGRHVLTQISKSVGSHLQVLKVTWNCPSIDSYDDFDVGPPAIVVRRPQPSEVEYVYLRKGLSVSLAPVAKFCRGGQDNKGILPCKKSDKSNPFGQFMMGSASEQCVHCSGGFECTQCLSRAPLCDGYDVKCGNVEFAGNICCGLFALYVTRFGKELKVGTSMLSNVVGRLLEQGVYSALILHPIEGILNTHILEREVKEYLTKHLNELHGSEIDRVFTRAPPADDKLRDFLGNWNRDDANLLESVAQTLSGASLMIDGRVVNLSEPSYVIRSFLSNYLEPPKGLNHEYLRPKPLFNVANGKLVGYRGSFAFLDTGDVVDLRELSGYVVRGRVGGISVGKS